MAFIKWEKKYSVGIQSIDDQHKRIFDLVNDMESAVHEKRDIVMVESMLNELVEYMYSHLNYEERFFENTDYTNIDQHKDEHRIFSTKIQTLKMDYESGEVVDLIDVLNFLKYWLVGHILKSDMEYVPYIEKEPAS